jgi:hypothetical protein
VKQQPKFKARVRKGELDSRRLLQRHRCHRKFPAFVVRFLQVKNDPHLIVSNRKPLFRLFLSLVSNLNGCAREGHRVRSFGMNDFHVSRRKFQSVSERTEVIRLCLLALRDNKKSFAGRRKARPSTPESRRPSRK